MAERFVNLPDSQQNKQTPALKDILSCKEQNLSQLWQDEEFLLAFPKMALGLLSIQGRMEFSQDERAQIFSTSLDLFLSSNYQKLAGVYLCNAKGEVLSRTKSSFPTINSGIQPETTPKEEKTDSFTKLVLASILLIGFSLGDREKLKAAFIQSHKKITTGKRNSLVDALGRFLEMNNVPRAWIKNNKLDLDNGFNWDSELAWLLLFGIYSEHSYQRLGMPSEMRANLITHYSLETLNIMLDYSLDQVEEPKKVKSNSHLSEFITFIESMLVSREDHLHPKEMIESMKEKLKILKEKAGYTENNTIFLKEDSDPPRAISYVERKPR